MLNIPYLKRLQIGWSHQLYPGSEADYETNSFPILVSKSTLDIKNPPVIPGELVFGTPKGLLTRCLEVQIPSKKCLDVQGMYGCLCFGCWYLNLTSFKMSFGSRFSLCLLLFFRGRGFLLRIQLTVEHKLTSKLTVTVFCYGEAGGKSAKENQL